MKRKIAGAESQQLFTYGDYCTWPENERWELIDGVAYDMTPAPGVPHQRMLMELGRQFGNFFLGKPCEVFVAPLDVRLPNGEESDAEVDTVVQPDLLDSPIMSGHSLNGSLCPSCIVSTIRTPPFFRECAQFRGNLEKIEGRIKR